MGEVYPKRSLQNSPRNYNRSRTGKVVRYLTVVYWSGRSSQYGKTKLFGAFSRGVILCSGMYLFCDHLLWLHSVQLFRKSCCCCYLCIRRKLNKCPSGGALLMISEKSIPLHQMLELEIKNITYLSIFSEFSLPSLNIKYNFFTFVSKFFVY